MGAPDHTLDRDAHASILDDSRRLTPVDIDSYSGAGQGQNDEAYVTTLVLRLIDGQLVPESVHVHTHGFTVTKWEAKYSSIWSDAYWNDTPWATTKLVPVVDHGDCVVGHAGWIDGIDLCVASETLLYEPAQGENRFWKSLEELRLSRLQGQGLVMRETERRFKLAVQGRAADAAQPIPLSPMPRIWESDEVRHRNNVNYFLSGGGKAIVGEGFDVFNYSSYMSQVLNNEKHGYAKFFRTSGYRFLVLVNPEGFVQAVMDAEVVPPQSFGEKALEFALGIIDVAAAILLVVDIATIPAVLLRAGVVVARGVTIRAVKLVANMVTKAAEGIAERDVLELLKMARIGHFSAEELAAIKGGARSSGNLLISAEKLNEIIPKAAGAEGAARKLSDPERNSVRKILGVLKRMQGEPNLEQQIKKMLVDLQPMKDSEGRKQFERALKGYAEEAGKRKTVAKALRDLAVKGANPTQPLNELAKLADRRIADMMAEAAKTKDWAKFKENLAQFVKDVGDPPPWADIKDLTAKKLEFGKLAQEGWHEIYVMESDVGLLNQMRVLFRLNGGQLEADILMMH